MTRCFFAIPPMLLLLVLPTPSGAQSSVPQSPASKEPIALGGVVGVGLPAQLASVRLSLPFGKTWALDLDAGRVHGLGNDGQVAGGSGYGAQLRWLWHGRNAEGLSGYWLGGPLYLQATNRTTWRAGNLTGVLIERAPIATVQFGYGWDWISASGTRAGIELSKGGGEGPVFLVNVFVQWAPPR